MVRSYNTFRRLRECAGMLEKLPAMQIVKVGATYNRSLTRGLFESPSITMNAFYKSGAYSRERLGLRQNERIKGRSKTPLKRGYALLASPDLAI